MKRFLLLLFILLAAPVTFAEDISDEDYEQYRLAIEYSDNGNANLAIDIYNKLIKKYPDYTDFHYELGYCYMVKQDFKKAYSILSKAEKQEGASGNLYALEGNCLDNMGKPEIAIAKYEEGLARFPDCGHLYLELGIMHQKKEEYDEAVSLYRRGIEAEPDYTSNYFRCASLLCYSSEPVWGIVYAEIHQLLQRKSRRSDVMSKAMYDAYNNHITVEKDTLIHYSLTQENMIQSDKGKNEVPFEAVFEILNVQQEDFARIKEKGHLDLTSLVEKRRQFFNSCFTEGNYWKFYYPVFRFQQKVLDAGYWEAYNMWLLRKGNEEEFDAWYKANALKYNDFIAWFNNQPFDPKTQE